MSREIENIDNLYRSELNNFTPKPPAGIWNNIEEQLAQKQVKKTAFPFYKLVAGIALLLASGSLGVFLFNNAPNDLAEIEMANSVITGSETNSSETNTKTLIEPETATNISIKSKTSNTTTIVETQTSNVHHKKAATTPVDTDEETTSTSSLASAPLATLNNIEAEVEVEADNINEKLILYPEEKPQYTEAYLNFLAEFEDPEEKSQNYSKWAVGGQAGPQYSYRQLSSNELTPELLETYNSSEDGLLAYAGGIHIAYKPARRLSIQSGVYYSKMGQTSPVIVTEQDIPREYAAPPGSLYEAPAETAPDIRISSSLGDIAPKQNLDALSNQQLLDASTPLTDVEYIEQHLEYLEVPLLARYAIIDRKVNFHLLGGVSTNFLVSSPVYLNNGDHYTNATNLNKVNYSSTLGLGLGYKFSTFALSVEPQFKYYLNKINTSSSTNVHPYSFGVFTGVTYLF